MTSRGATAPARRSTTLCAVAAMLGCAVAAASGCGPPPRPPASGRLVPTVIAFRHGTGNGFAPVELSVAIDGAPIVECPEIGSPFDARAPVVLDGRMLASGNHVLEARVVLRGEGFGIFAYLRKYRFTVRDKKEIVVPDAKSFVLRIETHERPDVPLEDRPFLTFTGERDLPTPDAAPGCPAARRDAAVAAPE